MGLQGLDWTGRDGYFLLFTPTAPTPMGLVYFATHFFTFSLFHFFPSRVLISLLENSPFPSLVPLSPPSSLPTRKKKIG